jgi:thiol-disulfide isomerase/thioredoxin
MKKSVLLILYVFISNLMAGQAVDPGKSNMDPFCRMVKTLYSMDLLSFNSKLIEKQVFERDTITSYAKVIVGKEGIKISFLRIMPRDEDYELLFCNDSAWLADHINKRIECIGTDLESLDHNHYSNFFPFSLYNLDTTISKVEPFWKVIRSNNDYTVISLEITNKSPDLSDTRVEFTIGNSDFLPYGSLQESVYMKADKFFQEQVFSDYSIPSPGEAEVPDYFTRYKKDLSLILKNESQIESSPKNSAAEIYLHDIKLFDLAKNHFHLPENGIIFIDLWYVGCPPCMKSAPVIEKLYHQYKDKVYFFSINETDQDTAKIARFKEKMGITFPVLLGGGEKLAGKISGRGSYPVFILMDAESGKVLWKMEGYAENLELRISEAINQNL